MDKNKNGSVREWNLNDKYNVQRIRKYILLPGNHFTIALSLPRYLPAGWIVTWSGVA
jgi:hypothetical protein